MSWPAVWAKPWDHKLDVSDIFHAEDLSLSEKAEKIAARIRARSWFDEDDLGLVCVVEELEEIADGDDSEGDEDDAVAWFDGVWSDFYDWCDAGKRVWVTTR